MMAPNSDFMTEAQYLANPFVSRDPNAKDRIESFMQRMGITNGGLTEQFTQFVQERMARPGRARPPTLTDPTPPTPTPPRPPTPTPQRETTNRRLPKTSGRSSTAWAACRRAFRPGLRRMTPIRTDRSACTSGRLQGGAVSEFQKIDLNGDGFITVDEALRYQKTQGGTAVVSNGPSFPGAPSFSGFNGVRPPSTASRTASTGGVVSATRPTRPARRRPGRLPELPRQLTAGPQGRSSIGIGATIGFWAGGGG